MSRHTAYTPGYHGDLAEFLRRAVLIMDGEGSVDLNNNDEVYIAIIFDISGFGPHQAVVVAEQFSGLESAMEQAHEILEQRQIEHYPEHVAKLQEEWGDEWNAILTETFDGACWAIGSKEAAEAIRGSGAEQYIEIIELEEEDA